MKKQNKKIISVFAIIAIICSLFSNAFAATDAVTLQIGDNKTNYDTVAEAVAAVPKDNSNAVIILNDNFTGSGVKVNANQNITFDLNNFTWDITNTVGSTGTETNGLQLLKGSTVKIQNGYITSKTAKLLIQNYCNLTLDNVKLSGTDNLTQYIVSNNNGSTTITGGSEITAAAGGMAFDSDKWGGYDGGNVILESGTINGNINATNGGKMTLNGGTINGEVLASNYTNAGYDSQSPVITINGTDINGKVSSTGEGKVIIQKGVIDGIVDSTGTNKIEITGGTFLQDLGNNVNVNSEYSAKIGSKTVIGEKDFNEAIKNLKSGDSIELLAVPENTKLSIPDNVKVINNSGNKVIINDENVNTGGNITTTPPSTTDQDKNNSSSSSSGSTSTDNNTNSNIETLSPQTSDNSNATLFISIFAVSIIGITATIILTKKQHN